MALSHVRGRKNHTGASRPLVEGTVDDNQKIAIARARESGARRCSFSRHAMRLNLGYPVVRPQTPSCATCEDFTEARCREAKAPEP